MQASPSRTCGGIAKPAGLNSPHAADAAAIQKGRAGTLGRTKTQGKKKAGAGRKSEMSLVKRRRFEGAVLAGWCEKNCGRGFAKRKTTWHEEL